MGRRFDVCVVGSANLDLVALAPRHPNPGETVLGTGYAEHAGGKGLNQAVAAARSGADTAFVGALGVDAAGADLLDVLDREGIDATAVGRTAAPTGRAVIVVDDRGENSIVVVPGANATVPGDAALPPARVVLAQLEIPLGSVEAVFDRLGGAIGILNPAPAVELPDALVARCDVIVPNEHEIDALGGPERLLAAGCGAVVVTMGAAGARIVTTSGSTRIVSFDVQVVDTTGAGDAFCGALAARLAAGDPLETATRWANAAGALATTVAGAVPAQPHAAAIRALLASGTPQVPL